MKYKVMLLILWLLNAYDAISTLFALKTGLAKEANPLMRALITASPLAFLIIKLALGSLIVFTLWKRVNKVSTKICIVFLVVLYTLIDIWNTSFWLLYSTNSFVT